MKTKGILITLISVVFAILTVLVVFALFTVKQVDVKYNISTKGESFISELKPKLDSYVGKNLVFIDTDEIKDLIEENPYFEVQDIQKRFPNVIDVKISERKEVYTFAHQGKEYILSDQGIVLSEVAGELNRRDYIKLELKDNISVTELNLGSKLVFNKANALDVVCELAKSVNLTDCIKEIYVNLVPYGNGVEEIDLSFKTYSGVEIVLQNAERLGLEKVNKAFDDYDNGEKSTDYIKTYDKLLVYANDNDEIITLWTYRDL